MLFYQILLTADHPHGNRRGRQKCSGLGHRNQQANPNEYGKDPFDYFFLRDEKKPSGRLLVKITERRRGALDSRKEKNSDHSRGGFRRPARVRCGKGPFTIELRCSGLWGGGRKHEHLSSIVK